MGAATLLLAAAREPAIQAIELGLDKSDKMGVGNYTNALTSQEMYAYSTRD
jgi:hypothetical protein